MRCLLIGALLGASISVASAGEPSQAPAAFPKQVADAAEHLRTAAQHLEEAGLPEQAARLRDQAAELLAEANGALLARKLDEAEALRAEIAELRRLTGRERQVVLRVTVLEIDRDKVAEHGVDWPGLGILGAGAPIDGQANTRVVDAADAASISGYVEWLRKNELCRVLAEPTMVTLSERPASFNVGGEFPVPTPQADGSVSIEYKQFGTQVEFVPVELGGGALRLQIRARVSELDHARSIRVGDLTVPGLNVREVETGAELERGQILVIGGLTSKRVVVEESTDDEDPLTPPVEPRRVERTSTVEMVVIAQPQSIDAAPPVAVPQARRDRPALNAVDAPRTLPPR